MKHYAIYEQLSGRIAQTLSTTDSSELNDILQPDQMAVEIDFNSPDVFLYYVLNDDLTLRTENPATLHGLSLNNVPIPSVVNINGQRYPTDESTIDLEFDFPGTYKVWLQSFPFLDKEFEVEA